MKNLVKNVRTRGKAEGVKKHENEWPKDRNEMFMEGRRDRFQSSSSKQHDRIICELEYQYRIREFKKELFFRKKYWGSNILICRSYCSTIGLGTRSLKTAEIILTPSAASTCLLLFFRSLLVIVQAHSIQHSDAM